MKLIKVVFLAGLLFFLTTFSLAQVKPVIDRSVYFESTSNFVSFEAKGGTKSISITASDPWSIKSTNASWCALKKSEKQLMIMADENNDFSRRSGYLILECESKTLRIDLIQKAADPYLSLSTQELRYDVYGGTKTITVTANGTWRVVPHNWSWIHLSKDGNALTVRIDPNPNTISRSGSFSIMVGDVEKRVNVMQKAEANTLSLSQQELIFDASGGTRSIIVTTTGSWDISTDMVSWGHLTKEGNSLKVIVDPNPTSNQRTDWFEINSGAVIKRVNVFQEGSSTNLSLSSQDLTFSSLGGTQTITIYTNGTWRIGVTTYSWGHLTKDGNSLKVKVDANTGADTRTDYFTIRVGDIEKRVNITQFSKVNSWEISGYSCSYSDNAVGLNYIFEQVEKNGACQFGTITEYGKGIVVFGDYGSVYSSIPNSLAEKLKELNVNKTKITSITLTNSGYYCVVYQRNGWYGVVPEQMKKKLNEYNANREKIVSVSICENGNFAIVTDEHYYASNSSDLTNMKTAFDKYGSIMSVCVTNKGVCVVCQNGIYYCNIPSNLESKLQKLSFHPDFITFTDSGTYLITTKSGNYSLRM